MKQLVFCALLLSVGALGAQDNHPNKSFSFYAGLSPFLTPVDVGTGYNAPGIQHEVRHNPFVFGAEYTRQWRGKWHYFVAAQGGLHFMQGRTDLTPPQNLGPGIVRIVSQDDAFEAVSVAVGGGLQLQVLQWKGLSLRTQAGAMAGWVHDRGDQARGIDLLVENDSGELVWQNGGTVQHKVSRQVVPLGRLGAGIDFTPAFAKGFGLGVDAMYLVAPRFMEGSWTRNDSVTDALLTQGAYETGWNNLILAGRLLYRW